MSAPADLIRAILGHKAAGVAPDDVLAAAARAGVDPLRWCALRFGQSETDIMSRAAAWAGIAFFDVVPRNSLPSLTPARLETLAEVRMFRLPLLDREVAFAAPDFAGILRLEQAMRINPELHNRLCLVPASALRDVLVEAASEALIDGARQNLARSWPHAAAQLELTRAVRWSAAGGLLLVALAMVTAPLSGQIWLAFFWVLLVAMPASLRVLALLLPPEGEESALGPPDEGVMLPDYSILVPLRDEANMVDQLCRSLSNLDYPAEKLEIIFVVESRSDATVAAVRRHLNDPRFSIVVVPDALPRTKPKALDFALPLCRGQFVVVYDAEDRPEPDQLRRIATQFRRQPEVECIQARLVIANGETGGLPALFAGEYAGLFAVLLPALAHWGLVTPLGGTSNHFRLATLRQLGGWDAYNVTEDADLGVRLARRRLRTATSTTRTLEDAPSGLRPWLGQRTRWMKGWMQTFVVHNRHPVRLYRDLGLRGLVLFQVVLLGMLLAPLLHMGFGIALALQVLLGTMSWPKLEIWPIACLFVLLFGYAAAMATKLMGLARTGQSHLWPWQLLLPFYWFLIGVATVLALVDFARRPFHWFKSPHRSSDLSTATPPDLVAKVRISAS